MLSIVVSNENKMPKTVKKQLGIMIAGFLPAFVSSGTSDESQAAYVASLALALADYDEHDALTGIETCKRLKRPPTVGELHDAIPSREISPERAAEIRASVMAEIRERRRADQSSDCGRAVQVTAP